MDKIYLWLAYKLPKRLVYWCVIRLGSWATVGKYSNQIVPELYFMDALERWDKQNENCICKISKRA